MIKWQKIILHHMVCSVSSSVVEIQFYSKMGDFTKYIFKQHNRTTNCRAAVIVIYRRVLQSPIALLAPPLRSDAPFFQTHAQKATALLCWSLGRKQIYCSSTVMPRHFSTQKYFFDHENGHTNSHLVCSRSQTNQIAALEEERAEAS